MRCCLSKIKETLEIEGHLCMQPANWPVHDSKKVKHPILFTNLHHKTTSYRAGILVWAIFVRCPLPYLFVPERILSIDVYKFHRIVADNYDLSVNARIQSKDHSNQSIHWTQQYGVKDRAVPEPTNDLQPQCRLEDLDLQKLLPNSDVQLNFNRDCVILLAAF